MDINRVELTGPVADTIDEGVTQAGSSWIRFRIVHGHDMIQCVAFDEVAEKFGEHIEANMLMHVIGEVYPCSHKGHRTMQIRILHLMRIEDFQHRAPVPKEPKRSKPHIGKSHRDRILAARDDPPPA